MTQKKTDTCRRYSTQQETLYAIEERRKINKDAADVVPMTAWETREGVYWGSQESQEACTPWPEGRTKKDIYSRLGKARSVLREMNNN